MNAFRQLPFHQLHRPGEPFVLPCAWDVASACLFAEAGRPAIGTTSLGVAAGIGAADEDRETLTAMADLIGNISQVLPKALLTCDFEDGYSDDPGAVVDNLRGSFAVETDATRRQDDALAVTGINIEDSARGRLVAPEALACKVNAIKEAFPGLFVNARIDTYWTGQDNLGDTLERMRCYVDSGADGIFVPGDLDLDVITRIVEACPVPVNVLASPRFSRNQLAESGVARISTGSLLYRTAISAAVQSLEGLAGDRPAQTANVLSYLAFSERSTAQSSS
ncbi:2-Methylisocitrate lyase, PEP mutase family [Brevibacterium sandarakinum]|uniref:2-Methylisocitrate lyase, PEP mutase family n=1 Tax=Brevibacterium sandarakinum TaxID=629680 RepID=A0A1H1P316_BRESA|nr:isocitrate lyase/phosphoenolpyruvate mutase family protein [Brevibacterium sandarakinum]SDS05582.1 2-Methylisocitrate lyase, PEP mutase family [Brevibacterium sandarakinum]